MSGLEDLANLVSLFDLMHGMGLVPELVVRLGTRPKYSKNRKVKSMGYWWKMGESEGFTTYLRTKVSWKEMEVVARCLSPSGSRLRRPV